MDYEENREEMSAESPVEAAPETQEKDPRRLSPKALRRKVVRLQNKLDECSKKAEKAEALEKELAESANKIKELENQNLYEKAELENYRKRALRERSELLRYDGEKILRELLEVADNFDRALLHAEGSSKESLLEGLNMIRESLKKLFAKHEVKAMAGEGEKFDPNVHEALTVCPAPGKEDGTILAVNEEGYFYKDHVLRPAKVVVVQNPPASPEEKKDE